MADNEMADKKLKVLLTEYKELRNHINENKNHQIQLFTIIISALGVIYGIIFANATAHDLILILPLIILVLGLRFQYESHGVDIIGGYLKQIEDQIRTEIPYPEWNGYQNYYVKHKNNWKGWIYDDLSKYLLFVFIPMSISIYYSKLIINNEITNVNGLPICIYQFSALIYLIFILECLPIVLVLNNLKPK